MSFKYKSVALGGTFDLLHIGHKALIKKAFEVGEFVTIGITTDKFGKNTFNNQNLRLKNLKAFLKGKKYRIIWLDDIFGNTLKDASLEVLVVSPETKPSAQIINRERRKKGLKVLDIIVQPFIKDELGKIISSSRIRQGEINPEGISYKQLLLKIAGKKLSESLRNKLKEPFGRIVSVKDVKEESIISIGDISTLELLKTKKPKLAIIDYLVQRQPYISNIKPTIKVLNLPGQISEALISKIETVLRGNKHQIIQVLGEEDLAAIPAILLSPLGTAVLYGQPNKGLVKVRVDLEIKDRICKLLSGNIGISRKNQLKSDNR